MPEDRDKQREQIRSSASCPPIVPDPVLSSLPDPRPTPACDPVPEQTPDVFTRPDSSPATPTVSVAVPPVPIGNTLTQVTCAQLIAEGLLIGPSGDPVTIAPDTIVEEFIWLNYTDITTSQLEFLAGLNVDDTREYLLNRTLAEAVEFFHLTNFQTQRAQTDAAAIQASVNSQASEAAKVTIVCGWFNTAQTATCSGAALTTAQQDLTDLPVLNPSVTAAGTVFSTESLDAANEEALNRALQRQSCVYGNTEVTRDCAQQGFVEAVPTDTEVWPNLLRKRVGAYTVPANSFFSTSSTAEAVALATVFADSQLDCFYINDELSLDCTQIGKVGTVPVEETTEDNGRLQAGLTGNPVEIPDGWVLSDDPLGGTAAANEAANLLANSLLDCHWVNAEVKLRCPNETVKDPNNGQDVVIPPSARSPVIEVTIPAGALESLESQADADQQALDAATSQLDCLYCNLSVLPTCIPADVLAKVKQVIQWDIDGVTDPAVWEAAGIPDPSLYRLPLNIDRLVDAGVVVDSWSSDATLGAGADVYCDPNAQLAQQIGVGGIQPPISLLPGKAGCRYGNDDIQACCGNPGNLDPSGPQGKPPAPIGDCAFVPKDTFEVVEADVPADFVWQVGTAAQGPGYGINKMHAYANTLAYALARSMLVCIFCNQYLKRFCDQREIKPLTNVHKESIGWRNCRPGEPEGTPVIVEACTFVSTKSQEDADKQARKFADASLFCFYMNRKITVYCADDPNGERSGGFGECDNETPGFLGLLLGPGKKTPEDGSYGGRLPVHEDSIGSAAQPAIAEKDSFISMVSQDDADQRAITLTTSMLLCFWISNPAEALCGAQSLEIPWSDEHALNPAKPLKGGDGLMDGKPVSTTPGKPGAPFQVEGGITMSTKGPKTASKAAWTIAKAGIICCVGNHVQRTTCVAPTPTPGGSEIESEFSESMAEVAEDMFQSCQSLANANAQALRVAKALLICSWTNNAICDPCSSGFTLGVKCVEPNTFHSKDGSGGPNASAQSFIASNKECVDPNELSGDDGRQTNCQSKCLAIFS